MQKFVKSKGRKPSITRLFWKLPVGGGSKSVVGWSISNVEDFAAPPTSIYARSAEKEKKRTLKGSGRGTEEALHPSGTEVMEDEIAVSLKSHLFVGPSERAQLKVKDAQNYAKNGHYNVCSLTNTDGVVTDTEMDKVTPFKMSPKTIEDPEIYTERIVSFLQKYAETQEGLLINVTEIVCDFIKDDNDKWWFIQIKGLRLCRRSRQQIHRWIQRRAEDDDSDYDDEAKESFQEQYKRKIREAREKAKENMDNQCKMCGIFYTEGELISKKKMQTFDTTEDEELRLEEKLKTQHKAEHMNLLQQQEELTRERVERASEEQHTGAAATGSALPPAATTRLPRSMSGLPAPASPDTKKSPAKTPIKSAIKTKPRNPSFKELKGETDVTAIAQEEGVNADMVRRKC